MIPKFEVELIKDKKGHFYKVAGKDTLFPGCTTVLNVINKPALIPWASKQAAENIKAYLLSNAVNRPLTAEEIVRLVEIGRKAPDAIKDKAAGLGTKAHAAIDAIIKNEKIEITPEVKPAVDAFMKFVEQDHLRIEGGDTKLASLEYEYGGSLDIVGFKQGKAVIVDIKTSKGIWPEMALQVGAYAQAFKETYGLDYLPEGMIVRVGKETPDLEVKHILSTQRAFEAFRSALDLYRHLQKNQYAVEYYTQGGTK